MNALLAAIILLQSGTQAAPPRVQAGVRIQPDTVTVGDPFLVVVRIRAPRGAVIEFPQTPDSGSAVEAIDPVQVSPADDTTAVEQTAVYRVAAWDVGPLRIPFADVLVRSDRSTQRVSIGGAEVFVSSVLPADSALWTPKPVRDVFSFGPPWWLWALLALAVAAIAFLIWWLWHRRRRRPPVPVDAFVIAERGFERVEALGLVAAGERARHVALMVEVLRDYLAALSPEAATSRTSFELLSALRGTKIVPLTRLAALLSEVDLVKFAARHVAADRALELGAEARRLAAAAHAATAPPPDVERAA